MIVRNSNLDPKSVLEKRINVMREVLIRIEKINDPKIIQKYSNIVGGLVVFFQCELGDEL